MLDLINRYGSDSLIVKTAATMFGSTETTFYVLAVYFGAINVRKVRHAVAAGLIADISAMILAVYVVRWLFA
jgi:spore maturation protein B